MQLFLLSLTRT